MEKLHHPNIIRLYEVVETLTRLHLGGWSTRRRGALHENHHRGEAVRHRQQDSLLSGPSPPSSTGERASNPKDLVLDARHDNNIIHRDLKAENVFYTCSTCVKVGDFGFSTVSRRDETLNTFCGSPPYAAPELFRDQHYTGVHVDVWALGVLLFFMVTGTMPFRAETVAKLKRSILEGTYAVPAWVPEPCQRLIRAILQLQPSERCSLDQMMACEWLRPVDFPKAMEPFKLDPLYLAEAGPAELEEDEIEVRSALEKLGITTEHIRNNQGKDCRSSITGVYRILLHRAHKRRAVESMPVVTHVVNGTDVKKERLKAYRSLRHTSKLCAIL
ncbi:hypothetical protein AOLI_G00067010 [Acnodon oligacanthus]